MSTPPINAGLTILRVWLLLLGLGVINIATAYVPIGAWTWTITYPIAATMTALIMIYYMHLRDSTRLVRIVAGAGFFWLMLLFFISFADYLTRQPL